MSNLNNGQQCLANLQKAIALLLALSLYVLIGLNDTFWTPFLPNELANKGISKTLIGVIVSGSDGVGFLAGVYFMFFFKNIGQRKFLLCFGDFIIAIGCLLFGQLDKAVSGTPYVVMCFLTRACMGCGITLIWCSGAPLLIAMFPKWTGSICSWIAAAISIGIISGAPLGSYLYAKGGFTLPFWVVGSLQVVIPVLCYVGIPDQDRNHTSNNRQTVFEPTCKSAAKFLCNSGVLCLSVAATFAASSLGFFSVSFSPHLEAVYGIGSADAGRYYLPFTISRAVSAPFVGFLVDKGFSGVIFTFCGCLLTATGFFFIYLGQFVHVFDSFIALEVIIAIIGVSSTAAFIPLIPLLRKIYPLSEDMTLEMVDNYAAIMYSHCFALGLALGESVIAGVILDNYGFYPSCFSITVICTITGAVGVVYLLRRQFLFTRIQQPQYEMLEDDPMLDCDVPMIGA